MAKMAKAAKLAKAAKAVNVVKTGAVAAKGFKLAAKKSLKMIPFIGNVIAGGFAAAHAWELYKKWKKDPKSITPSDKIQMVAELAGMIPFIGNAVSAADLAMSLGGGYETLDTKYKKETEFGLKMLAGMVMPANFVGGGILYEQANKAAGIPTNFDDKQIAGKRISAPPEEAMARSGRTTTRGGKTVTQGRAQANPLSIKPNGDFEVKLTIENFASAITGHRKKIANSVSGVG